MEPIIKFFVITLFAFVLMGISIFLYTFIIYLQFYSYLKMTNYSRWCELTTVGKIGPGGANSFRGFSYLRNDLDTNDENILRYKHKLRYLFRYVFWIFLGVIAHCIFLAFLIM